MFQVFVLTLLACLHLSTSDEVLLETPLGSIKGKTRTTIDNIVLYSFQGIPYAEPMVNESRFQDPKPKQPWQGVLDATAERSYCRQITYDYLDGDEDCLFLNIYSPKDPKTHPYLPVMVFIHGGAFNEGSSVEVNYGPDHIVKYGVIYVSLNYRLGPFGFLSTGDDVVPGNAGLKDQTMALRFLQKYIHYFGGNAEQVTIFGQSAGASSVHYHVLSPLSKGLFKAAICESASALSPWAYQADPIKYTRLLASTINPEFANSNASSQEIYDFLRKQPADVVDRAGYKIYKKEPWPNYQIQQGMYFGPVIEHQHENAFITNSMYESLRTGDINNVTLMIGFNSEEFLGAVDDKTFGNAAEIFTKNISLLVPDSLNVNEENKSIVAGKIKDFYSPYLDFDVSWRQLITYLSDQCFVRSIIKAAQLQSQWTQVYLYEFQYHGVLGGYVDKPVIGFSSDVRHGEEISFLQRRNYGGLNTTDLSKYPKEDQLVQERLITMFTNLVKRLDPTPERVELFENIQWPPIKPYNLRYMAIGSSLELRTNPKEDSYRFWNEIYDQYGVPPFNSY
ncbi:unnamed protein product [Phyllotreta striolata]|uniref:Carboxylic ester hydrolase n=1 Tax=Phyllotreta striolata TaxID=444603 RepID=A0A9N9TIY3_PHYSR|nr:unnamed protein product [Phyllotreta striolata]